MSEVNGVDAMIAIRGEFTTARLIVLTTYTGPVQICGRFKAARGLCLKNLLAKELWKDSCGECRKKKGRPKRVLFNLRSCHG